MKIRYIALCLAALTISVAAAKSPKRGVCENQFSMGSMLEALEPGVSWYYNWANVPGAGYQNQVIDFEGIEFVPMCWNANYDANKIREYCKSHPQTKYLLGFNEPNFTAQANMTPQKAAEEWPAVQALAKELGLKLVAPALNYSPNPPYYDPLKWMDEFVALVGPDAFDYTAVHNYGGLEVMKTLAGNFHNRYGKDVWVTEFCYWPNEGNGNDYVSPENQINSMVETVKWLETTPWIYRYAWFKPINTNANATSGPNYRLLDRDGNNWFLTEAGKIYTALGEFEGDMIHPVAKNISSVEFSDSQFVGLGISNDSENKSAIEITRFNAGATATWQFDIKDAGEHLLTLRVGGYGEPTRFDPQLQWVLVEGDKESPLTEKFSPALPNSDTKYEAHVSKVMLPAGKVQLRLKDLAPSLPSGMRISTVRVDNVAGVEDIIGENGNGSTEIYNLQGVKVGNDASDWDKLPKGIYIIGGKKILK